MSWQTVVARHNVSFGSSSPQLNFLVNVLARSDQSKEKN